MDNGYYSPVPVVSTEFQYCSNISSTPINVLATCTRYSTRTSANLIPVLYSTVVVICLMNVKGCEF